MSKALLVGLVATLGLATSASAQYLPLDGRLYVGVNGLYQTTSLSIDQRGTFSLYDEDGAVEASQRVRGGAAWDVGFGYTVWRELAFGLDIAQFSREPGMNVSGTVPHPLFFDSPRAFAADASSSYKVRTIALLASWRIRMRGALEKVNVRVMAGPGHLRVQQGLASVVTTTEVGPPYSTVDVSVTTEAPVKNTVGFVGGVDIAYAITDNVGAGLLVRYAGGSVTFDEPLGGRRLTVKAGGFQVGGGVRLRF